MARRADNLREELAALDQEVGSNPVPGRQMHKVLPLAIAFVALFCFGGLTWYAYNQGILEGSEEAAPYLRPSGPLKMAPSNPGGVEVPNRDKFVYNRLENRSDDKKVEKLLPPPEQPKSRPTTQLNRLGENSVAFTEEEIPSKLSKNIPEAMRRPSEFSQSADKPKSRNANEELRKSFERAEKGTPPPLNAPATAARALPSELKGKDKSSNLSVGVNSEIKVEPQVAQTDPQKAPIRLTPGNRPTDKKAISGSSEAVKPKNPTRQRASRPIVAPAKKVVSGKGYFIQLGALRSRAAAERAWRKARGKYPDLLGSRSLIVEQANIPKKGLYYRVQSGPLANANAAKQLCNALKRRKQGCFVVLRR